MLLDEARIAATLNHPNVAHIYDVGVNDGQYFIAMEHVHGEDIRSIVRQMKKKEVTSFPHRARPGHRARLLRGPRLRARTARPRRQPDGASSIGT